MASTLGRSNRDLILEMIEDPSRFEFFQAVRLLALAAKNNNGQFIPKSLRFATPLTLAFQASELLDAKQRHQNVDNELQEDEQTSGVAVSVGNAQQRNRHDLRLTVGFMGLTGPSGALPQIYTELLIERRNNYRDSSAHQFLDLFSHRLISLFYAAWRKGRFYLDYEADERDRFTRNVLDLVGMGTQSLQEKLKNGTLAIPDTLFAHYAGLLSQKPVSGCNLAAVLKGYFKIDVEIQQFVGQWIVVPQNEHSRLGKRACKLGEDAFIGGRIWDRQTKIGITLGPLGNAQFVDFLPGQTGHTALLELVRFCVGHALACDVTLVLEKSCVPPPVLTCAAKTSVRLGCNTWLSDQSPSTHLSDTRYHLLA